MWVSVARECRRRRRLRRRRRYEWCRRAGRTDDRRPNRTRLSRRRTSRSQQACFTPAIVARVATNNFRRRQLDHRNYGKCSDSGTSRAVTVSSPSVTIETCQSSMSASHPTVKRRTPLRKRHIHSTAIAAIICAAVSGNRPD
jgi:hypothetical protein